MLINLRADKSCLIFHVSFIQNLSTNFRNLPFLSSSSLNLLTVGTRAISTQVQNIPLQHGTSRGDSGDFHDEQAQYAKFYLGSIPSPAQNRHPYISHDEYSTRDPEKGNAKRKTWQRSTTFTEVDMLLAQWMTWKVGRGSWPRNPPCSSML
jgi:hypothetical protein